MGTGLYIASGVVQLDTLLGGWERVTASYLVEGPAPLLVETGSQTSAPTLLRALADHGLGPADLAGIVVTHVHLDHAGGVGDIASAFPQATVYVHEKGARHLADPTRLVASAHSVYGDALGKLYGRMAPTPAERLHVLADGEAVQVGGGRTLTALYSPGHAKHHMALMDSATGVLFVGDAVGVHLPGAGALWPATPPADFDLGQALHSLSLFAKARPSALALAHFGLLDGEPAEQLEVAAELLREWAAVAKAAWAKGQDVTSALTERFGASLAAMAPEQRARLQALNGLQSNAAGLSGWLSRSRPDG
ncbi:MAG: MBL fold metallo-hydrolase [Acidimicrobiales bacterium]